MIKRSIFLVILGFGCFYSGLIAEKTPLNLKVRKISDRIMIIETE